MLRPVLRSFFVLGGGLFVVAGGSWLRSQFVTDAVTVKSHAAVPLTTGHPQAVAIWVCSHRGRLYFEMARWGYYERGQFVAARLHWPHDTHFRYDRLASLDGVGDLPIETAESYLGALPPTETAGTDIGQWRAEGGSVECWRTLSVGFVAFLASCRMTWVRNARKKARTRSPGFAPLFPVPQNGPAGGTGTAGLPTGPRFRAAPVPFFPQR